MRLTAVKELTLKKRISVDEADTLGETAAIELLARGGKEIADSIHHER